MPRCWFTHDYSSYEVEEEDGGYIQGLHCRRCGDEVPVTRVSAKGAELQREIDAIRRKGTGTKNLELFNTLLTKFQREVRRL